MSNKKIVGIVIFVVLVVIIVGIRIFQDNAIIAG